MAKLLKKAAAVGLSAGLTRTEQEQFRKAYSDWVQSKQVFQTPTPLALP